MLAFINKTFIGLLAGVVVNASNETKDLNVSVFNMTTGINESTTLTRHRSWECECKFDGRKLIQIKSGITINVDANTKKHYIFEKGLYLQSCYL